MTSPLKDREQGAPEEVRFCECGEYIKTNDPYMIDYWNEWHEDGSYLAGKFHRPLAPSQ
jgi:hypothetical protein